MVDFGGRRSGFEDDDNYYGRQNILRESPITLESKKQAQQKTPSFGLGELLAGLAGLGKGITDSAVNVGKSTIGMLGTGITSAMDLMGGEETRKGYNEGKNTDAFKRWLYGTDSKGQINYGKAAGEALDAATTLTNFIPGGGKLAANVAQGAVSGFANEYKEKGNDADLGNALKSAATGAATGAATSKMNDFVGKKMGELAEKQAANQLGVIGQKVINAGKSNFVRGAISGATGGAVGGGMATALNGGDLGQVLGNAVSTAGSGALQGGISGSVMGQISKVGSMINDGIDNHWTKQTNKDAINRLTDALETGADGNIRFTRLNKDLFNDINSVRVNNGLSPLTERQVTAYKNAVNNNLGNRVQEGLTPKRVAEIAFGALTDPNAEAFMGKGSNQVITAPYSNKKYNGVVVNEAPDGGTSLKSIEPRDRSAVDRMRKEKIDHEGLLGSPLAANQGRGVVYNGVTNSNDPNIPLVDQRPGLTDAPLGTRTTSMPQNSQNINSKTSTAGQLRLKATQALLDQYGTIDKPTARSAFALENTQKVADAGFTKPADVENMINNITGANGKVTKLTQKLVSSAKPVDTESDISKILDQQIALNHLSGTSNETAVRKEVEAILKSLPSRQEGSITGLDQPEDVFDVIKAFERQSADLKGKSGNNYRMTTPERTSQAKVLDSLSGVLKDRLYSGTNIKNILTPDVANDLKSLAPKNEKWSNYVDNTIMKANDIGELRSSVAPFVNMGKVIDNQYINYGTHGQRVGDAANEGRQIARMISRTPVLGKILGDIASSNVADRVRAKAYNYMADQVEARSNPTNPSTTTSKQPKTPDNKAVNLSSLLLGREVIPQTALNMIGRSVGNDSAYKVQDAMRANANDNISDYNQDLVENNINHASQRSRIDNSPITEQLTKIGDAMQLALNAGDVASYSKLAGLYGDMMNIYKTQQAMFNPQAKVTKLTDSQKKANVAMDLLNNLEGQQANVGSAVADVPILGGLMNIGGNEYKSSAEALESALGYLQSGAQISEKERESIRRAYIPQWGESEAVKKRKLAAARQVIQNFAQGSTEPQS